MSGTAVTGFPDKVNMKLHDVGNVNMTLHDVGNMNMTWHDVGSGSVNIELSSVHYQKFQVFTVDGVKDGRFTFQQQEVQQRKVNSTS